jgi:lipoprotein NlpD
MVPALSRFARAGRTRGGMLLLIWAGVCVSLAGCAQNNVIRETSAQRPQPRPIVRKAPKPGASVVVRRGDTLYRVAVNHGLSPLDLAMWNRIPPPYTIYPGQRLRLSPPPERRPQPSRPSPPQVATAPAKPTPTKPAPTAPAKPVAGGPAAVPPAGRPSAARPATPPPSAPVTAPAAAPASAFVWRWPAEGAIVARFSAGDPTKQGIGIAGQGGTPVRAAADGEVVYSGAGLIGYGELIIVRHSEQWLSAYGHNRARLVNEGQRVKAGEQIAEMGRSGAVRDMLHFEIRYNGKPQDPLQFLPKR